MILAVKERLVLGRHALGSGLCLGLCKLSHNVRLRVRSRKHINLDVFKSREASTYRLP